MNAIDVLRLVDANPNPRKASNEFLWEMVDGEERGKVVTKIYPCEISPFLFRGQNRRYTPCYPSVCRNFERVASAVRDLANRDQLSLINRIARSWWFCQALKMHPAMQWASQQGIYVDRMALAQHYGIPTGYFDLTESAEVALFFATCAYRQGRWEPVADGQGVLYRVSNTQLLSHRIKPIGLQPFPRPAEQWAWTLESYLGEDFETVPQLQQIVFEHNTVVGQEMLKRFAEGKALFPPDVMASVAERIMSTSARLPKGIVREVVEDLAEDEQGVHGVNPDTILQAMKDELQIELADSEESLLTSSDLLQLESDWNAKKETFFRGVGLRLVRERK